MKIFCEWIYIEDWGVRVVAGSDRHRHKVISFGDWWNVARPPKQIRAALQKRLPMDKSAKERELGYVLHLASILFFPILFCDFSFYREAKYNPRDRP